MNRRGFLKCIGIGGLAALFPMVFKAETVDPIVGRAKSIGGSWHGSEWLDEERAAHLKDLTFVYDENRPHLTVNKLKAFVKMVNKRECI